MVTNPQKLPSLDGWRAVSVSLVLAAHCVYSSGFPKPLIPILDFFGAGGLGVRFFFVISGFLITWLLLQEHDHAGTVNLKNFYIRRSLRIFPVCLAYLGFLAAVTSYHQTSVDWTLNLTYATDFHLTPFPTAHLWSLGVEEQFYLLWPFLLALCLPNRLYCAATLAIPLVVAPVVRLLFCKGWYPHNLEFLFQTYSFFSQCDALAYGCVAAIIFSFYRPTIEWFYEHYNVLSRWCGVALVMLPITFPILHVPARIQAMLGDPLQSIGFMLLMLQSIAS
jgi:peptidoglycan/LPS O-acetylase OafA/YrhL